MLVKIKLVFFVFIISLTTIQAQFKLKQGDLLFQDLDKDSIANAIEKVTKTILPYNFTHVGIVVKKNGKLKVLEAVSSGVQLTSIETFLKRNLVNNKPKVVAARLKSEFKPFIKKAIKYGETLIGLSYDNAYTIGDNSYYCSELVYEMFHNADPNKETFQLKPMTFKDSSTNKTLDFWVEYYQRLQTKIPEGELGINPNGMSVSPNIILMYDYYLAKKLN